MKLELDQDIQGILEPERAFDRRDFLTTALGASAALAASGAVSAQAIVTDAVGLTSGDVMIKVSDGTIPGYFAMPATGGPFAVILVAPEVFGLNPYMKDVCRRLAKAGYYAISPDVYARKADLTKITNFAEIMPIVNSKADSEMLADFDATAAFAKASGKGDTERLGMTGFCRGGRTTWMYAAHNPRLRAAVAWYGPVGGKTSDAMPKNPLDLVNMIKVPVLGLYGAKDSGIPLADVDKMRDALKGTGNKSEFVVYAEAGHGFNADFRPDNYRKQDAEDGWKRMLAWFKLWGVA
ncbi:MAG: dienelactone hydrolase family protein [Betaproteobacteria bacterium]